MVDAVAADELTVFLTQLGTVLAAGILPGHWLVSGSYKSWSRALVPEPVPALPSTKIIEIAAGGFSERATILLRTASGKVFALGEFVPGPGREESGDTMQQAVLYEMGVRSTVAAVC